MNNLHFVKVTANSGEEACQQVENLIMDFGNENNYRTMCGAISEDNEIYNAGEGGYQPKDTDYTTIDKINEAVNKWINSSWYGETARLKFEKGETNLSEWDSHELWSLSKLAEHLSNAHPFRETPFDFMKDDCFFEYQYDECGFTDLTHSTSDGDKIWIVFVDMHS
jgi:hypothetical protein